MPPSKRVISPWTSRANTITDATEIGTSRRSVAESTGIVRTTAAAASTSEILATFEPMMLPTPMSRSPWPAAIPDTTISGADVPNPMSTAPMTTGETL